MFFKFFEGVVKVCRVDEGEWRRMKKDVDE